jgi:hypothetical protein
MARRWTTRVAGFSSTIEARDGRWVVTLAGTTVGRAGDLAEAIALAGGGLVKRADVETLAASIVRLATQAGPAMRE